MSLAAAFARNLKQTRLAKNLSQEALAARAGYSVSMISMAERDQRTPPLDGIERLAKALGVKPVALLAER